MLNTPKYRLSNLLYMPVILLQIPDSLQKMPFILLQIPDPLFEMLFILLILPIIHICMINILQ